MSADAVRTRQPPPPFRRVEVASVRRRSDHLVGVTVTGSELEGWADPEPASSVRLLLPGEGLAEPVLPTWEGNEFLDPDGSRPIIRTLTPVRFDADRLELDLEVVLHGDAPLSGWADAVAAGDRAAVSGPGRGYAVPVDASALVLVGDETAIPAIGTVLAIVPPAVEVVVVIEARSASAGIELPEHPRRQLEWLEPLGDRPPGSAMADRVEGLMVPDDAHWWVAGEAAAVQRIRKHLFGSRDVPRARATVRGYWKVDRGSTR